MRILKYLEILNYYGEKHSYLSMLKAGQKQIKFIEILRWFETIKANRH